MAKIPASVMESDLTREIMGAGLVRTNQGKVRDTFDLSDVLLQVATNRLSIFDFVLPRFVPRKGEILTAFTVFWLTEVFNRLPHHLVAYGPDVDLYLPKKLRGNQELQRRAVVVRKLKMVGFEAIVRGYLTGSGWRDYRDKGGVVCGYKLSEGLNDGSKLPSPIFTPSTKAEEGHDENIPVDIVKGQCPWMEKLSLEIYQQAYAFAQARGIIIADTKFEFGIDGTLGDEILTPDSSRFWDCKQWEEAAAQRKSPSGYDKEPVRQWGMTIATPFGVTGLNNLDPANPEHLEFVAQLEVPDGVIASTSVRYQEIFERFAGDALEYYQVGKMMAVW